MTTFEDLRAVTVERMAEYHNQEVAAEANASVGNAVILRRLKLKYRQLYAEAKRLNPGRFVTSQDFTYPASTDSVDLSSTPSTSMRHSLIHRIEEVKGSNSYPLEELDELHFLMPLSGFDAPKWYIEGERLWLLPRPSSAVELRAFYAPDLSLASITTSTWGAHSPDKIPEDYHELIALDAAISFLGDQDLAPRGLLDEQSMLKRQFVDWATNDRSGSTRRVKGVLQ